MSVVIRNPYDVAGNYRKTQLHCHTTESDGRFRPQELLQMYKDAGYSFVCITDHNRVTWYGDLNDTEFLAIPGTEDTIPNPFRPLGPHVVRLFVDRSLPSGSAQDFIDRTVTDRGIASLAHPSWTGNLWTGTWTEEAVRTLKGYQLLEIWNPHSNSDADIQRWAAVLRTRGPESPVWGVAVDDCHHRDQFNQGWIMVKVPEISAAALREALLRGAFYASTGPSVEFGLDGNTIVVRAVSWPPATSHGSIHDSRVTIHQTSHESQVTSHVAGRRPTTYDLRPTIRFIDIGGNIRQESSAFAARYAPRGDEGYIRVECQGAHGKAWSQPFFVVREP